MMQHWRYAILIAAVTILAAGLAYWRTMLPIDRIIYDRIVSWHKLSVPQDLLIVAIDENSLQSLGRWPWQRKIHAQLLTQLRQAQARAVVLDIIFTDRDAALASDDQQLAQAIAEFGPVALPLVIESVHNQGQLVERLPLAEFGRATNIVGHVHVERDGDGVCRSVFLQEGIGSPHWPHLSVPLLQQLQNRSLALPGLRSDSLADSPMIVKRDYYNLISYVGAGGSIPHISYIDILENQIDDAYLQDKIIFVGMTATGLGDMFVTPVGLMSGVELNANIFQSLREEAFISPTNNFWQVFLSALIACGLVTFLGLLSPKWFLGGTLIAMVAVLAASFGGIWLINVWFPPASILTALLVFYPLWNWQRLERALSFLQAELELTDTSQLGSNKKQRGVERYVPALTFIQYLYPELGWKIFDVSNDSQIVGSDPQEANTSGRKLHFYRKNITLEDVPYLVEMNYHQEFDEELRHYLDRNVFAQGDNFRQKKVYGVEVVEKTLLALSKAQKKSLQNQELARQSVRYLPDAIVVTDYFGQLQYANDRAKQAFHIDNTVVDIVELISKLASQTVVDARSLVRGLCLKGTEFSFEGKNPLNDKEYICRGQKITFSANTELEKSRADDNSVLSFFFTDITQLKLNERSRLDTLHFLSHDIRSPMTSVLALIETAKLDTQKLPSELLGQIQNYVDQSLNYTQQFIQLAKAEEIGEDKFYICEIQDIVDNAVDQIYPTAKTKGVDIEVNALNESASIMGDGDLLERLFNNLLVNAVKFSPANSLVCLDLIKRDHNWIEITISDEGPGIPSQQLPTIFERFKKGPNSSPSGVGLGLYFVKLVCERHGGSVQVRNNQDRGATFSISLPLCQPET